MSPTSVTNIDVVDISSITNLVHKLILVHECLWIDHPLLSSWEPNLGIHTIVLVIDSGGKLIHHELVHNTTRWRHRYNESVTGLCVTSVCHKAKQISNKF